MAISGDAGRTVLTLTAEQSAATVIELRDADGKSLGLLMREEVHPISSHPSSGPKFKPARSRCPSMEKPPQKFLPQFAKK